MRNTSKRSIWALTLAATASWTALSAQNSGASADEEVYELSPFEVDASQDVGYQANSTTAGSRLNTELRDVAASVTVLTDDFMDDLGALNVAEALSFVAGVETDLTSDTQSIHLAQGFLGNDFGDPNTREGSVRVRGLGQATQSANYLEVYGPIDRYNMERTEFLRGPNALLFGLGKPGGVINYSTKKARLHGSTNKLETVFDQFGTQRYVLDVNRVAIKDILAVRAVGMYSNEKYMFKKTQNRDKRVFLTTTIKPLKNTRIEAYVESIDINGNRPNYRLPQDNVTDWLREFNKAHDMYSGAELEAYLDRNLVWDASWSTTANGRAPTSPDILITERIRTNPDGSPLITEGEYRRENDGRANAFTAFYTPENGWENPLGGHFTRYGTTTISGGDARNTSPNARLRFMRSSFGNDRRDPSYLDRQVLDEGIFPYLDYELSSLPGNQRRIQDQKIGLSLDQKVMENMYFNVSYLKESYEADQNHSPLAQTNAISIDINKYLPGSIDNAAAFTGSRRSGITLDEAVAEAQALIENPETSAEDVASNQAFLESVAKRQPNPNYLRPFFHGRGIGGVNQVDSEAYLAQINYDFDFSEKTEKLGFLGRHRLTAFASGNRNIYHNWRYTSAAEYTEGVIEDPNGSDRPSRWFWPIFYIGDPIQPGDTSLHITGLPNTTIPNIGDPFPYYSFSNAEGDRGTWSESTGTVKWRQHVIENSPTMTKIVASAWGGSLQSFFWSNRIVGTLGYRQDTVENFNFLRWDYFNEAADPIVIAERERRGLSTDRNDYIRYDIEGDGHADSDWVISNPVSTQRGTKGLVTKSLVFHVTPWLRVFGNQSENFALTTPTEDGFRRANPPQGGETTEYGFGLNLFQSKLDLKMSFYETSQVNELGGGSIRLDQRLNAFEDAVWRTLGALDQRRSDGETTAYGIEDWQVITGIDNSGNYIIEHPGERIPEVGADGNQLFDELGRPRWDYLGDFIPVSNPGVTQDSISKGWELSGTYNPTRNIRIFANVSKLENRLSNKERQVLDFVQARAPYWKQFFDAGYHTNGDNDATEYIPLDDPRAEDPDFVLGSNQRFGDPAPVDSLLIDDFYQTLGNELLDAVRDEGTSNIGISEYNARIVANYTFYEGFLKGFSFGTSLRGESGKVFGYPVIHRDFEALPEGFPNPDVNGNGLIDADEYNLVQDDVANPYQSDPITTGGIMFSYRKKIRNNSIDWRIQLNVNNLFKQGGDLRIINVNPDESPVYGINVPTTFRLTNTFSW